MCVCVWKNVRCKMKMEGFYISETVVIFITKLIEMCVRLRSARVVEGEREELGGEQESGD